MGIGEIKSLQFVEGLAIAAPALVATEVGTPDGSNTDEAVNIAYLNTLNLNIKNNVSSSNPTASNDSTESYSIGSQWFNSTTGVLFQASDVSVAAAVWEEHIEKAAAQVLTNKDYDGGTASATKRFTLSKDTRANLNGLARKEATTYWDTTNDTLVGDDGSVLVEMAKAGQAVDLPGLLSNVGLDTTVAANAMTVALKQKDGTTDPASGTGAVGIAFRNSTIGTGGFGILSRTSALSIVISSGATLGTISGKAERIYVYGINNSGALELAASRFRFDEHELHTTTVMSGSADDGFTLYSTISRANVPIKLLGHLESIQAAAGTWVTNAAEIYVGIDQDNEKIGIDYTGNAGETMTANVTNIPFATKVKDSHTAWSQANDELTAPKRTTYDIEGAIHWTSAEASGNEIAFYVGGTKKKTIGLGSGGDITKFSGKIDLAVDEVLAIRTNQSSTLLNDSINHWITITTR